MITPVSGTKFLRSNGAAISNPYNGIPSIEFMRETIATFTDNPGVVVDLGPATSIHGDLSVPTTQFNLINPIDGTTVVGTATYQDVYVILYSLYMSMQAQQ
jgi:hypothetical protein